MSSSLQSVGVGFLVFGLLLHLYGLYHVYRKLRYTVPSWWKRGTKLAPRMYVTGRLMPGPVEMRSPLSGRPCAAWRLSVACLHPELGHVLRTFETYSEGSFSMMCDDGPLRIELDSTWDGDYPISFLRGIKPAWLLPFVNPKDPRAYTVGVLGRFVTLPDHPRLSNAEADAARLVALKAVQDSNISSQRPIEGLAVIETILDFERVWACEGPQLDVNGVRMMVSQDNTDGKRLEANPAKFAPYAELRGIVRRVALRQFAVILYIDAILAAFALIVLLRIVL